MIRRRHKKTQSLQSKPKKLNTEEALGEQTFLEHVHEVRKRVFWITLVLIVASAIGFQFKDQLISTIMLPLDGQKLIYLTPGGGFSFIFAICLYFGLLFTIPMVVYQLFRFLQPMIGKTSRKFVAGFLFTSTLLAAAGALFGYFVTIPAALGFLSTFAGDAVTPSLTAESYLNFVVTYIVGLALIFQLPLLLFIFDHIRPFPPGMLKNLQRPVIVGATIVAALITPTPDAVNMAVVGLPIVFVYEVGATAVFVRRHSQHKHEVVSQSQKQKGITGEPLTEIIQELEQRSVQKTAVQVHVVAPSASVAKPIPQPSHRKVVDGFGIKRRQVQTRTMDSIRAVPSRQIVPPSRQTRSSRPLRSVDGLSMV